MEFAMVMLCHAVFRELDDFSMYLRSKYKQWR